VKFLVDNQLPAALARFLASHGHDTQHVLDVQMDDSDDQAIWNRAALEGRVVVSKDEDFIHFAARPGAATALVWVRLPNCRKHALLAAFERALPALLSALEAGNRVVEIR
jgi:predicted nuclease of predicted toxin-antitoxin system